MAKRAATHVFSSDEQEYYYFSEGNKENPCLLLIPGFTGLHDDLIPLAKTLEKGHYVLIPDLPGWGKSARLPKKLTIDNYATFLKALLDHEQITKVTIIGHCMGAATAIAFCNKYQQMVAGVFLVSVPYQEGMLSNILFRQAADISVHTPKRFRWLLFLWRNRVIGVPLEFLIIQSKSFKAKTKRIVKLAFEQGNANEDSVEENWNSLVNFPFTRAKELSMPVHIIHGAKDIIIPLSQEEKFHALIPEATFDTIPQAGHIPPIETPESLGRLIESYL